MNNYYESEKKVVVLTLMLVHRPIVSKAEASEPPIEPSDAKNNQLVHASKIDRDPSEIDVSLPFEPFTTRCPANCKQDLDQGRSELYRLFGPATSSSSSLAPSSDSRGVREILLGMKKRGFGMGKWNGFGGKVEANETIEQGAVREIKEEAGVDVSGVRQVGVILFEFTDDPRLMEVHIFTAENCSDTVTESEEMLPRWFNVLDIPLESMWKDDSVWFPLALTNTPFIGYMLFEGHETILFRQLRRNEDVGDGNSSSFLAREKAAPAIAVIRKEAEVALASANTK